MTAKAIAQSFDPVERRTYLGASEIASVMGLDRYKTPLDIFNEKMGLTAPFEGNNHTERGNALEAIAAEFYTKQTGKQLRRRSEAFTHPAHAFIVGHVDRVIVGERHLIEIKCPSIAAFRRFQRDGLPESYVIQANVYMGLAAMSKLTFVIFCADAWDAAIFTLDFDGDLYAHAINAAFEFWTKYVQTGTAPAFDAAPADIEIAKQGGTVTVRDDEAFIAKVQALKEATDLKRDAEELHELAKKDLIDAFEGECGAYQVPGLARIYYTQSAGRVTFDKKKLASENPSLDLTKYEKQGKGFFTLRSYFEG